MTTKKDLVEAHAFSRRRLVTAFVSGAPGGREVEPTRPGRTIVGGVAIAVLLVAGAAVASVLSPRASSTWEERGLVVTKAGERYVVTKDKEPLRPVINLTSAQLVLGLDPKPSVVSADTVRHQTPGATIGIAGAPESLPTADDFIESGWTACTQAGLGGNAGVAVAVQSDPAVRSGAHAAFVVTTGGDEEWLIAEGSGADGRPQARSYRLPNPAGPVLQALFGRQVSPARVPASWLALFPQGTPIGTAGFRYETPAPSAISEQAGMPDNAKSGDLGVFAGQVYLVLSDGVVPLSPFQAAVYQNTTNPRTHQTPSAPVQFGRTPTYSHQQLPTTDWPTSLPKAGDGAACAELVTSGDAEATVRLAVHPGASAWPTSDPPSPGAVVQHVEPGKGAFVYSGRGSQTKGLLAWIIDSRGVASQLGTNLTISTLGLADYDAPVVPDTWVKLFGQGVALSTEQALCPPAYTSVKDTGSCAPRSS
ncbi:type VII secretion protein EccB [Nocardioides sp. DS6]|uniref:Type VII secretion protein EccB n=1 Tax=Nocardioides eburneus TaxID=3231482 RepID=A0ABV3SZF6_9ACTN